MKEKIAELKIKYRQNPGWCWLLATIFLFPILPEYVSPFILFIGFIIFKVQWSREGRKAKVGTLGKLMIAFMTLALASILWSETKFSTLATAGLWWGMFLIQVMIYNLARTRKKIDKILSAIAFSAALNGLVGLIQIGTYTLNKFGYISEKFIFITPFYKYLDQAVYEWLPFEISTKMWESRASGFFSNPNLLATYIVLAYPLSIYLFLNAKDKRKRIIYFCTNVLISCGMSSTMTRAGCVIALAGWIVLFVIYIRHNAKKMIIIGIPTYAVIVPSILTRYGILFTPSSGATTEAKASSAAHLKIWSSLLDYLSNHFSVFLRGTGFGSEYTKEILSGIYDLDKPHAHNFVLEIWMELGVIGVALLALVIFIAIGKVFEINANNGRKFTLVVSVGASLLLTLLFGLTDYIFNSPKQIILFFMLLGIIQAISYTYEKTVIHTVKDFERVALQEVHNALK